MQYFFAGDRFRDFCGTACFQLFNVGHIELFVSKATLAELRRVLMYPEVRDISPNMTQVRIGALLQRLTFRATLLHRVCHVIDYPRDPNDEPYIDLAIAAKANFLISPDKDLLSLMTGHSSMCKQFRQLSRPLKVLDPPAFLAAVSKQSRGSN